MKKRREGTARKMKVSLVILAAVSALSSAFAETQTLTTWNLEWFPGRNPAPDFAREAIHISLVHEELEKIDPDILLLQEVRDAPSAELAVKIVHEMKVRIVSDFAGQFGNGQQLVIASRVEPLEVGCVEFPQYRNDPPRGFVYARFQQGGKPILVYNVHLKSNNGGIPENIPKREIAIRRLIAHYEAWRKELKADGLTEPVAILGGDYNSDPGDPRFAIEETTTLLNQVGFHWALGELSSSQRVTWPSNGIFPDASLDHFFFTPGDEVLVRNPRVHHGSERAADHRAVSMDLTVIR